MARTITTTHTRLVLSSAEREIARSWGRDWAQMRQAQTRKGGFWLLFGEWSGYSSRQTHIVHVEYRPLPRGADHHEMKLRQVIFTDGTSMTMWLEKLTLHELLRRRIVKKLGYASLIWEARESGKETYVVGEVGENEKGVA